MLEMFEINDFLHLTSKFIELGGVLIIALGILFSTFFFVKRIYLREDFTQSFSAYRMHIAQAILLGLELLVASDIIGTVLIEPSMQNVLILGLIVIIRTFLSYSLEVEIEGRFPWQRKKKEVQV